MTWIATINGFSPEHQFRCNDSAAPTLADTGGSATKATNLSDFSAAGTSYQQASLVLTDAANKAVASSGVTSAMWRQFTFSPTDILPANVKSVAFFFRLTGAGATSKHLVSYTTNATNGWVIYCDPTTNAVHAAWIIAGSTHAASSAALSLNTTYFCVCTIDGSNVVRVYIDGTAYTNAGTAGALSGANVLCVHGSSGGLAQAGRIDEINTLTTLLSQADVDALYAAATSAGDKIFKPNMIL